MATAENLLEQPPQSGPATPKVVRIFFRDNRVTVDPERCNISKGNHDSIQWVPMGDFKFYVCFGNRTPFGSYHFNNGVDKSGEAVGVEDTYKYNVEVEGNVLDPDVIVQR